MNEEGENSNGVELHLFKGYTFACKGLRQAGAQLFLKDVANMFVLLYGEAIPSADDVNEYKMFEPVLRDMLALYTNNTHGLGSQQEIKSKCGEEILQNIRSIAEENLEKIIANNIKIEEQALEVLLQTDSNKRLKTMGEFKHKEKGSRRRFYKLWICLLIVIGIIGTMWMYFIDK